MSTNRHDYYLQLKARGYYKNTCACGRKKSIQARICRHCSARGVHRLATCPDCGRQKSRYAKICIRCKLGGQPLEIKPAEANAHCPNPGLGGAWCDANYPHHHCECGYAIDLDLTRCAECVKDAARIANKRLTRVA